MSAVLGIELRTLVSCWLLPGWGIGVAGGLWAVHANVLFTPIDAHAARIVIASAGAVTLIGLGAMIAASTAMAFLAALTRRFQRQWLDPRAVHLGLAAGFWLAFVLRESSHMIRHGVALKHLWPWYGTVRVGWIAVAILLPPLVYLFARRSRASPKPSSSRVSPISVVALATLTVGAFAALYLTAPERVETGTGSKQQGASWYSAGRESAINSPLADAAPIFDPLPEGLRTEPRPAPLLLVAVDGLEPSLVDRAINEGKAPSLARLRASGTWSELQTMRPTVSPRIWTTVATGRLPEEHGVLHFVALTYPRFRMHSLYVTDPMQFAHPILKRLDDPYRVPYSSRSRRVKALWNIASEAGLSVGVSGWMASWPAEPVQGFVVSDHAFLEQRLFQARRKGEGTGAYTHPAAALEELADLQTSLKDTTPEILESYVNLSQEERSSFSHLVDARQRGGRTKLRWLTFTVLKDNFFAESALRLQEAHHPDVMMVYLQAFDQFAHYTWRFNVEEAASEGHDPAELARYGDSMMSAMEFIDRWVGRLVEAANRKTNVIVLSDHGWGRGPDRGGKASYGHEHAPPGVLIASGPTISKRGPVSGGRILDVAPTLLYLLGLPISEELAGEVLTQFIVPEHLADHPPRSVPTYETGRPRIEMLRRSDEDDLIMENLKALGYID